MNRGKTSHLFEKNDYGAVVSFFLAFLILLMRGWERIIRPGTWAEDGMVFLGGWWSNGAASLFQPYEGYFHFLPRFIAALVDFFPLKFFPVIIYLICISIYSFAASEIARIRYRPLIPDDFSRICIALVLCLAPGLTEVLGNLANLHWIFFYMVFVRLIAPKLGSLTVLDVLVYAAVVFSAGEVAILIPLMIYRVLREEKENRFNWWLVVAATTAMTVYCAALAMDRSIASAQNQFAAKRWAAFFQFFCKQILIVPALGASSYLKVAGNPFFYYLLAIALLILGCFFVVKKRIYMLSIGITFTFAYPILILLVRPDAALYFNHHGVDAHYWQFRYAFVLALPMLLFWGALVALHSRIAIFVFLLIHLAQSRRHFFVLPFEEKPRWYDAASIVDRARSTGCPVGTITLPIHPGQRQLIFNSPDRGQNCSSEW